MKKILVVLGAILCLVGCGVPSRASGSGSSNSSNPELLIPAAYARFYGVLRDGHNNELYKSNLKVDAAHQDRIYEEDDLDGPYKLVSTWYRNGQIKRDCYYDWDPTKNIYLSVDTYYDSYELNMYGKLSKYVKNSKAKETRIYNYPGYLGTGEITTVNIIETYEISGTTTTSNIIKVYERSLDGLRVTENTYEGGVLADRYCYEIVY